MDFMTLAAVVCREFTESATESASQIVKVKGGNSRDVVTKLDMRLHQAVRAFVHQSEPMTVVMSEEDAQHDTATLWRAHRLVVVDPLDGTNNYALAIPGYGFMAAHLVDRLIVSSVVVLPEHNLYMVWDSTRLATSRPILFRSSAPSASIYYAYPPSVDEEFSAARGRVLRVIDQRSAGIYRSGSACIGLYQLLTGAHKAFVGHQVRVWDVLSYLPILAQQGLQVRYKVYGLSATIIASSDAALVSILEEALANGEEHMLHEFDPTSPILIENPWTA